MAESVDAPNAPGGHLTLIGTGHVLDIASKITDAIRALRPEIVCVELDRGRLHALRLRKAGQSPPVQGGWLQKRLHQFQESIAAEYGVRAGDEMLAAADAALLVGAQLALVDRPIQQTMQRVTKQVTWVERFRLIGMMLGGAVKSLWNKDSSKEMVERELSEYNADPATTLASLEKRFPTIHRVVLAERDEWMAKRLAHLLAGGKQVVAVVGDGHVDGIKRILADQSIDVFRLPDVQAGRLPVPQPNDTSSLSIGFDINS